MSFYYQLDLQFKGTRFLGWQKQKDFEPTVQDTLETACSKIFKSDEISSIGSGRTDTGVHSLGHKVKVKVPFELPPEAIRKGLNSHLPTDIRILKVKKSTVSFKPTNDAIKKEYIYLFSNFEDSGALQNDFIVNNRFSLDIEVMKQACKLFIGKHDFKNFYCVGSDINSTVREIYECNLEFKEMDFHGILPNHYVFSIVGNGFLKQMVRLIVGTLWEVGRGKVSLEELSEDLASPGSRKLGITAPPNGLYKRKVCYKEDS